MSGRRRPKPVLGVVTDSDHPNSMVGLCHPDGVDRDPGGHYSPSKAQLWLWDKWDDLWTRAAQKAREFKADLWWWHLGDGVDDNDHGKHGLVTLKKDEIVTIGAAVKQRGRDVVKRMFYVRGTPAHVGAAAELEELCARELKPRPEKDRVTNRYTKWAWKCEVRGVKMLFKHRPISTSTRFHTRGGGANRTAAELVGESEDLGHTLPDVAYYGHFHHQEDSGSNFRVHVLFTPPFCLHGTYEATRGFSAQPIGARLFVCDAGHFESLPLRDWIYCPEEDEWWQE